MTEVLALKHKLRDEGLNLTYTVELKPGKQFGPTISMGRGISSMGPSDEVRTPGGMVFVDRFGPRSDEEEARSDYVMFTINKIKNADLLVAELTRVGAGLMVDDTDSPETIAALKDWLTKAIAQGQAWLEAAA